MLFAFSPEAGFNWNNDQAQDYIQRYLKVFWIHTYLDNFDQIVYAIALYFCCFLVLVLLAIIFYVSYCYKH